jgi:triacylglycerol esterase/lipase EstA (alpha/beta hydrolase family)
VSRARSLAPVRDLARSGVELGRELRAVVRQGRLIAGSPRPVEGVGTTHGAGDRLVIFVHGFMARGPVFGPMRAEVAAGAEVETIDVSYGPLERFEAVCERVRTLVESRHEGRPVTLVGHSLGGLVSRWVIQEMGAGAVDRLITLASPHAGTSAAKIPAGPLVEAIRPRSPVIERLHASRDGLARVGSVAVVAGRDRMITPPRSAAELPGARVVWLDHVGHNEILFDGQAIDVVKRHVR